MDASFMAKKSGKVLGEEKFKYEQWPMNYHNRVDLRRGVLYFRGEVKKSKIMQNKRVSDS